MQSGGDRASRDLTRRRLLATSGGLMLMPTPGCDVLSTDPADPGQNGAGNSTRKGGQAPALADQVESGALPPLDQRLPADPLVVEPTERVGAYGGTLTNALLGRANSAYIWCIAGYENLVRWSEAWTGKAGTAELVPNVAEHFEATEDSTAFTFALRPGMRWSDGEPFTADDVVFAIEDVLFNEELFPIPS